MSLGLCGSWILLGRLRGRREVVRGGYARADVMRDGAWPQKGGRKRVGVWVECCGARGLGMLFDEDVAERCVVADDDACNDHVHCLEKRQGRRNDDKSTGQDAEDRVRAASGHPDFDP